MAQIGTDTQRAIELLKAGKLVAIPTETVYGLAANALNEQAVAAIFAAKERPHFDPLIVHLHDRKQLEQYCLEIPEIFNALYRAFCPGPVTFILKRKEIIPDLVCAGHPTVGIRFPRHPLTRDLLLQSQLPLAAPSANPFGYVSPTTAQHVQDQLGDRIEYILDGGPAAVGLESTIIDLSSVAPRILRLGGLALEAIERITGPLAVETSSSNPSAPGMLSAHYSPGKKVLIGDVEKMLTEYQQQKVAVVSFSKTYSKEIHHEVLSPSGDLNEAATRLFAALRRLDAHEAEVILAEKFPDQGLGKAINDRLKRAAAG